MSSSNHKISFVLLMEFSGNFVSGNFKILLQLLYLVQRQGQNWWWKVYHKMVLPSSPFHQPFLLFSFFTYLYLSWDLPACCLDFHTLVVHKSSWPSFFSSSFPPPLEDSLGCCLSHPLKRSQSPNLTFAEVVHTLISENHCLSLWLLQRIR